MADGQRGHGEQAGVCDADKLAVSGTRLAQKLGERMQEMMGMLPSLLQAKSEGGGQEVESGGFERGATAGAGEFGELFPGSREELLVAGGVSRGDTARGESSSRPAVECEPVRALGVPAEGGFGGFRNINSRLWKLGSIASQGAAAAGGTGYSVTATGSFDRKESSAVMRGGAGGEVVNSTSRVVPAGGAPQVGSAASADTHPTRPGRSSVWGIPAGVG